jgi:hypothetical protein
MIRGWAYRAHQHKFSAPMRKVCLFLMVGCWWLPMVSIPHIGLCISLSTQSVSNGLCYLFAIHGGAYNAAGIACTLARRV